MNKVLWKQRVESDYIYLEIRESFTRKVTFEPGFHEIGEGKRF